MNRLRKSTLDKRKAREANYSEAKKSFTRQAFDLVCALPIWALLFRKNCERLVVNHTKFQLKDLPPEFNGYKILFISDMHLEIRPNPISALLDITLPEHDIVMLGGDFFDKTVDTEQELLESFLSKFTQPVYAVLGNHDSYKLIERLEKLNVQVLLNESIILKRANAELLLTGIDDVTSFESNLQYDSASQASQSFSGCKLLVSHNPDFLEQAAELNYNLQLSGHTHGGQFKIFNQIIFCQTKFDFATAGAWQHNNLAGFTSTGFGSSGYPIRNISPEIALIELNSK